MDERILESIALFPKLFGMYDQPSKVFRLSPSSSYVNSKKEVILYAQVLSDGKWLDYAKGTVEEMWHATCQAPKLPEGICHG